MTTRKARPVHFEASQEGPDSVIPEGCASLFFSWPSGIIKAPLHSEGVAREEFHRRSESVVESVLPGSLNAKMLQRSCLENSVWARGLALFPITANLF